jgi:hypothetical protein
MLYVSIFEPMYYCNTTLSGRAIVWVGKPAPDKPRPTSDNEPKPKESK